MAIYMVDFDTLKCHSLLHNENHMNFLLNSTVQKPIHYFAMKFDRHMLMYTANMHIKLSIHYFAMKIVDDVC